MWPRAGREPVDLPPATTSRDAVASVLSNGRSPAARSTGDTMTAPSIAAPNGRTGRTGRTRRALGVLAGLVLGATLLAAPAVAATTDIKPATLEKGDAGYAPHVDGDTLRVADLRFDFHGRRVVFLGYGPDQHWVVGVYRDGEPASNRVISVDNQDERTTLLRGVPVTDLRLGTDGEQLFRSKYLPRRQRTLVHVWQTGNGDHSVRRFRGFADVLDAFDGTVVLGATTPDRTVGWDMAADTTTRISDHAGYRASIRQDRLAAMTGDPYDGGCSVVSTLTDPETRLWRSCRQAVVAFSPSGSRAVTTYLLADGLGPGSYEMHEIDGTRLQRFTAYVFGEVTWEADELLLLHTYGEKKSAWVRCDDTAACERTSRLRDTDF